MSPSSSVVHAPQVPDELRTLLLDQVGSRPWSDGTDGARIAVTTARLGVSEQHVDDWPDLEAVVSFGAGHDALPLGLLRERGIVVSTSPHVLTGTVADTAVALLLAVVRDVPRADRFVRDGAWPAGPFPLTRDLAQMRVGIVGLGRIGQAVARRLSGFDCEIGYTTRSSRPAVPFRRFDDMAELSRWSDALVVTVTGGGPTRHLVGDAEIRAVGPAGYIVNVARGSVVDQPALIEHLRAGTLAGAALDVFADEPHVPEALLTSPGTVLTPHIGSATTATRRAMAASVVANVRAYLQTGELLDPLDVASLTT